MEFQVRRVEHQPQIAGQVQRLAGLLSIIVAAHAMPVEDRLNFGEIVELAWRAVPRFEPARLATQGVRRQCGRTLAALESPLVAADAAGAFAWHERGPGSHRLHHHLLAIEGLEEHEAVGGTSK